MRRSITADDLAFRMRALLTPEDRARMNAADRERGLPDLVSTVEGPAELDVLLVGRDGDLVEENNQCCYCEGAVDDISYDACEGCRDFGPRR